MNRLKSVLTKREVFIVRAKRIAVYFAALVLAGALTACPSPVSGGGGTSTVSVTGVSLNKSAAALTVGGTEQLTATISPSEASDKTVTWSTSSAAVATVNASGLVTAVAAGTATITVTTTDGGKTAACAVTVTAETIPSSRISAVLGAYMSGIAACTVDNGSNLAFPTAADYSTIPVNLNAINDRQFALDSDGNIYAWTDSTGLTKYNNSGTQEVAHISFSTPASSCSLFVNIKDPSGQIYLCSSQRNEVYGNIHFSRFDRNLSTRTDLGLTGDGSADGQFNQPWWITGNDSYMYVFDGGNYRIQAFDKTTGSFAFKWGSQGSGNNQFDDQYCKIFCDSAGNIWVISQNPGTLLRIKVFSPTGTYIKSLEKDFSSSQQEGIIVLNIDPFTDTLYGLRSWDSAICKYDLNLNLVSSWIPPSVALATTRGSAPYVFKNYSVGSLVVDPAGNIFIYEHFDTSAGTYYDWDTSQITKFAPSYFTKLNPVYRLKNADGSVKMEYTITLGPNLTPSSASGSYVFTNYQQGTITVNGTLTFTIAWTGTTEFTYSYGGTLHATVNGSPVDITMNYTLSSATAAYTGTITVNGIAYQFNPDGTIVF